MFFFLFFKEMDAPRKNLLFFLFLKMNTLLFGWKKKSTHKSSYEVMSTYGNDTIKNLEYLTDDFLGKIAKSVSSLESAEIGLGPYFVTYWNETNLRSFMEYVWKNGGKKVAVFRLLNEADGGARWPADFWWPILQDFVDGRI